MGFGRHSGFDLDVSAIAGFFGGEESIAAMSSVNLTRHRRYFGWYNSPGSYFVSKKYGIIAGTRVWDGLFPGKNMDPATILGLDGQKGPRYLGAKSGTRMDATGHLAYLLHSHGKREKGHSFPKVARLKTEDQTQVESGHIEIPVSSSEPHVISSSLIVIDKFADNFSPFNKAVQKHIKPMSIHATVAAVFTIAFSVGAAVLAAVHWHDFFCCIAISTGIICNGVAAFVYGSGSLAAYMPITSPNSVPADGVLVGDRDLTILQGPESTIAGITRGRYTLSYPDEPNHHRVGFASMALAFQAFSQLILMPVATLEGQTIFLVTFAVSWIYNAYLASIDREDLQSEVLMDVLGRPKLKPQKVIFEKWNSAVAASAFCLRPINVDAYLSKLIPNRTPIWDFWRKCMAKAINTGKAGTDPLETLRTMGDEKDPDFLNFTEHEKGPLEDLMRNASIGYRWYHEESGYKETSPDAGAALASRAQ